MRDCTEIKLMLGEFAQQNLDRDDRIACSLHLDSCPDCRGEYQILVRAENLLSDQPEFSLDKRDWNVLQSKIMEALPAQLNPAKAIPPANTAPPSYLKHPKKNLF